MKLADKVAIITGSASGIGRATALLFAKEGAKVMVVDVNDEKGERTVEEIKATGGEAIFIHADVTQISDVKRMVHKTVETFGKLDILFNNAGMPSGKTAIELEEEEWDRVVDLNLKSIYICSKNAVPVMIKSGGGSIINMSSIGGLVSGKFIGGEAFSASKGAVVNLTRSMALHFGSQRIRVNCVCPGHIMTPMTEKWLTEILKDPVKSKELLAMYPLGRLGKPEEVAQAVLFLASDEASFITGVILPVDGGYTAL